MLSVVCPFVICLLVIVVSNSTPTSWWVTNIFLTHDDQYLYSELMKLCCFYYTCKFGVISINYVILKHIILYIVHCIYMEKTILSRKTCVWSFYHYLDNKICLG
jgi:hypothetical protein